MKYVNEKFVEIARDIMKRNRAKFTYAACSEVYECIYSKPRILGYKLIDRLRRKKQKLGYKGSYLQAMNGNYGMTYLCKLVK